MEENNKTEENSLNRFDVIGLPVDLVNAEGALERVEEAIRERSTLRIVTLNAEMAVLSRKDREFGEILKSSGLVLPDGSGVVWAARRQGKNIKKLAGVDFLVRIAEKAAAKGWKIYLLGAKPSIVSAAAEKLKKDFPGLSIVGCLDGYFEDEAAAAEAVRLAAPDILFAALGVPRQEKWIARYQEKTGVPVCMGVGGSFDVLAGSVQRAPRLMRDLHLEWLYRLYREPWRWRRMIQALPLFVWLVWRGAQGKQEGTAS